MNAIVKSTALSGEVLAPETDSEKELSEREARIERAQRNAYYEIGLDLAAIRDKQLYKVRRAKAVAGRYTFKTFEEYVETRWEWHRTRAYQIIEAAKLAHEFVENSLQIPSRESHLKPLLQRLQTDEERSEVWRQVVIAAADDKVTAKLVETVVERYLNAKAKDWITLTDWKELSDEDKDAALHVEGRKTFNDQKDQTSIEWARWSWNPITGCRHDCPYCYARDIAARFYPQGFEPSIYPSRLTAPNNTKVPPKAESDISYKNVFTGSMADIFGRWVPAEWIEAVLKQINTAQQWNFLLLTKFPKRMSEFKYSENAWLGTSVDLQVRVKNAEKAMAALDAGVRWLSIEPLIEPLKFTKPELFQWVVIGGASRSAETPAWEPPFEWIARLYCQFKDAGAKVYLKDNIGFDGSNRPRGFPTFVDPDARSAADVMHYLKNAKSADQKAE